MPDSARSVGRFAIALCGMAVAATTAHADPPDFAGSAVRLIAEGVGPDGASVRGTAFLGRFDREIYIITAFHNVEGAGDIQISVREGDVGAADIDDLVESSALCLPEGDICVFRCTERGAVLLTSPNGGFDRKPVQVPAEDTASRGARLVAVGNPEVRLFGSNGPLDTYSPANVAGVGNVQNVALAREGITTVVKGRAREAAVIIMGSNDITRGFSGGPLLLTSVAAGQPALVLAGMLQGGDPVSNQRCWGVTNSMIVKAIKEGREVRYRSRNVSWPEPLFARTVSQSLPATLGLKFPLIHPGRNRWEKAEVGRDGRWTVKSRVQLSANGRLDGTTEVESDDLLGFTGEVVVFALDGGGNILWNTKNRHRYGVDLFAKRKVTWRESVPIDILPRVRSLRLVQTHSPTLRALDEVLEELRESDEFRRTLTDAAQTISIPMERIP